MSEGDNIFSVGIDLCSDCSQVSYSNGGESPVSVEFMGNDEKYSIPTVVSKTIGRDEWFAGHDAINSAKLGEAVLVEDLLKKAADKNPVNVDDRPVMPIELLKTYLGYLISLAQTAGKSEKVDKICVTFDEFNISVLNVVQKALEMSGIDKQNIMLACHDESYIYYAISQQEELRNGDVFLFEYGEEGLIVKNMYMVNERGTRFVMIHSDDFSEDISYKPVTNPLSGEYLDTLLTQAAEQVIGRRHASAIYLTGKAFNGEINFPEFIKYLCDRGRVFAGQNMYCKGACYQAFEQEAGGRYNDMMLACAERITTGIEIKISDRGREKMLRMVRPGVNWFGADCSYDFIVDDIKELEVFLSPVDTSEKQLVKVPLDDFPKRPVKATRISVSFSFTSDSRCHMMVKDMGFGEFFASSGRVINEELLL
ncbi:MAG: DUF5716 family protein [Butyrivibrio sp.]